MSEEEDQRIAEAEKSIKEYMKTLGLDEYDPRGCYPEFDTRWEEYIRKSSARTQLKKLPENIQKTPEIRNLIKKLGNETGTLEDELQKWLNGYILNKISENYFCYLWILNKENEAQDDKK